MNENEIKFIEKKKNFFKKNYKINFFEFSDFTNKMKKKIFNLKLKYVNEIIKCFLNNNIEKSFIFFKNEIDKIEKKKILKEIKKINLNNSILFKGELNDLKIKILNYEDIIKYLSYSYLILFFKKNQIYNKYFLNYLKKFINNNDISEKIYELEFFLKLYFNSIDDKNSYKSFLVEIIFYLFIYQNEKIFIKEYVLNKIIYDFKNINQNVELTKSLLYIKVLSMLFNNLFLLNNLELSNNLKIDYDLKLTYSDFKLPLEHNEHIKFNFSNDILLKIKIYKEKIKYFKIK